MLTTLKHSCADCHEIWEPQPYWTLTACTGLYRDCITLYLPYMSTSNKFYPSCFPAETSCARLISPVHSTCPGHFMLPDFISLIMLPLTVQVTKFITQVFPSTCHFLSCINTLLDTRIYEDFYILGCNAVWSDGLYRRFGGKNRFHCQSRRKPVDGGVNSLPETSKPV